MACYSYVAVSACGLPLACSVYAASCCFHGSAVWANVTATELNCQNLYKNFSLNFYRFQSLGLEEERKPTVEYPVGFKNAFGPYDTRKNRHENGKKNMIGIFSVDTLSRSMVYIAHNLIC